MSEVFNQGTTFEQLGLRKSVLKGLTEAGFEHPTHIQAALIPEILAGRDVIGQAKTGTGKTAAFGLPILQHADPDVMMQALILVPTRELAVQVADELEALGQFTPIRSVCIIGGHSSREQVDAVQRGGHILVGTPGRVMDLHGRRQIHFNHVKFLVLDEIDRMLDIGFREDVRKILKSIKNPHQTIFVSATISPEIERLAKSFTRPDTRHVVTHTGSLTVSLVDQKYLSVEPWDKPALLAWLLKHEEPDTTVVFCRMKVTVHKLAKYLQDKGINARAMHGDLAQNKRNRVMASLRKGNLDVLVASDLAARGLDVEHISHVINFDLPDDPEVYIHRIGRTARAGRKGVAWSFVTPDQGQLLTEIEKLAGTLIEKLEYPDFVPGPVPADVQRERSKQRPRTQVSLEESLANRQGVQAAAVELDDEELHSKFPGGVVPTTAPLRNLGSKFRTRRG